MQFKSYPFNRLSFSDLFQTYVSDFDRLAEFYQANPFRVDALQEQADSINFNGNREHTADLLSQFNKQFDVADATLNNIERLKQDDSVALVTGQQLGLYGGPVFTMYKIITAIKLANQLEEILGRPVIPVFWLADEDHDYDEIRKVNVLNDEGIESFSLSAKENGLSPVSEMEIPNEIEPLQSRLRSTLIDTDFSNDLWKLLNDCFKSGETFLTGFGNFIARFFSKHGLVLAGSNHTAIKEEIKKPLITAVERAEEIREMLESQSQKIENKFHRQATVYDSHLFYLHTEEGRIKIQRGNDGWKTEAGQTWSRDELIEEIESSPGKFSPDVFLRPILQDKLLPTFGYVAGPGEVAYYGQMKQFYHCFNRQMPVVFPRLSVTFIEPAINRILQELPFEPDEYDQRIEDLESQFVDRTEQIDIESIFEEWKEKTESVSKSPIKKIISVDETLEGAAEKAQAAYFNELDKLKGKVYRAVKKREEIQLNRIRRIQQNLFPGRGLQERSLAGIYYMNKFGIDVWDDMLDEMKGLESLDKHQLIYI